ncbi:unnamed protein product [Zymoseptoria tritici ST99CH_1E4]|nr:unnamed protein product [Zymoseptoria tritici ST99CH_1E4]
MSTYDTESQDSSIAHIEKECLLDELNYPQHSQHRSSSKSRQWLYVLGAMIATNVLSIFATLKLDEIRLHSSLSPDLEESLYAYPGPDRSFSLVEFSERSGNATSRWTSPPSPAVDRAWVDLGVRDGGFLLPARTGKKVGLSMKEHLYDGPGTFDKDPDEEGFFVLIQGFHDIHCLNELRKALYFNKPYYKQYEDDTKVTEPNRRSHINHCLDNVRERLMCTADIGLIPSVYTGPHSEAIKFANQHKCHNYNALLEWKQQWEAKHPAFVHAGSKHELLPVRPPPDAIFHDPSTLS